MKNPKQGRDKVSRFSHERQSWHGIFSLQPPLQLANCIMALRCSVEHTHSSGTTLIIKTVPSWWWNSSLSSPLPLAQALALHLLLLYRRRCPPSEVLRHYAQQQGQQQGQFTFQVPWMTLPWQTTTLLPTPSRIPFNSSHTKIQSLGTAIPLKVERSWRSHTKDDSWATGTSLILEPVMPFDLVKAKSFQGGKLD